MLAGCAPKKAFPGKPSAQGPMHEPNPINHAVFLGKQDAPSTGVNETLAKEVGCNQSFPPDVKAISTCIATGERGREACFGLLSARSCYA